MAEGKKSFVLYVDLIHTVEQLPDDKAGLLFKHILKYVNDEEPISEDIIINIAFEPIKQQLKRDLRKWDKYIDKQRVNGSKGGRPKNPTESEITQAFIEKPKKADSVNVNVSVNDNVNDIKEEYVWTDSNQKFRKFLCDKFGVSELNQPKNYFLITRAINIQITNNKYEWFSGQCYFYFKYKEKSKEKTHGLKSFIGELDEIDLGNWNAENWDKKYQALKQQDTTETKANVQPNAKHRIGSPVTMKQLIPKK